MIITDIIEVIGHIYLDIRDARKGKKTAIAGLILIGIMIVGGAVFLIIKL